MEENRREQQVQYAHAWRYTVYIQYTLCSIQYTGMDTRIGIGMGKRMTGERGKGKGLTCDRGGMYSSSMYVCLYVCLYGPFFRCGQKTTDHSQDVPDIREEGGEERCTACTACTYSTGLRIPYCVFHVLLCLIPCV